MPKKSDWSIEKVGAYLTVLTILGGGIWWAATITSKLDDLEERAANSADDLCLAIVQRQILAIEKNRGDIADKLETLSDERGCLQNFAELASTGPHLHQEAMARDKFEGALTAIDRELDLEGR